MKGRAQCLITHMDLSISTQLSVRFLYVVVRRREKTKQSAITEYNQKRGQQQWKKKRVFFQESYHLCFDRTFSCPRQKPVSDMLTKINLVTNSSIQNFNYWTSKFNCNVFNPTQYDLSLFHHYVREIQHIFIFDKILYRVARCPTIVLSFQKVFLAQCSPGSPQKNLHLADSLGLITRKTSVKTSIPECSFSDIWQPYLLTPTL